MVNLIAYLTATRVDHPSLVFEFRFCVGIYRQTSGNDTDKIDSQAGAHSNGITNVSGSAQQRGLSQACRMMSS